MKKYYLWFIFSIVSLTGSAQNFAIDTVYFGFDRYELNQESKTVLDTLASQFLDYPNYYVEIFGHTDSSGTDEYNLKLSESRAREVAVYLISLGVQVERIVYEGLGTTKPAASNVSYSGRSMNRRVDVAVLYTQDRAPLPEPPVDTTENVAVPIVTIDPASLIDTIYCDYAQFNIQPNKSYRIITPKGTEILIPLGAFDTESEELSVQVKELFRTSEFLMNQMPMISRNGPLEIPAMFSFTINDGRRPVNITEGTNFDIRLPVTRRFDNVAVYKGSGGSRGGRRRARRGAPQVDPASDPGFAAVNRWNEQEGTIIRFEGREKKFEFPVNEPARYAVGRMLYYPMNAERNDKGFDMFVKIKGRRFPRNTYMTLIGENIKTSIPFKRENDKLWESKKIKYVDDKAPMILFALQYDDDGNPWVIDYRFRVADYVKKGRGRNALPVVKMKLRFKEVSEEELAEILVDIDN